MVFTLKRWFFTKKGTKKHNLLFFFGGGGFPRTRFYKNYSLANQIFKFCIHPEKKIRACVAAPGGCLTKPLTCRVLGESKGPWRGSSLLLIYCENSRPLQIKPLHGSSRWSRRLFPPGGIFYAQFSHSFKGEYSTPLIWDMLKWVKWQLLARGETLKVADISRVQIHILVGKILDSVLIQQLK